MVKIRGLYCNDYGEALTSIDVNTAENSLPGGILPYHTQDKS